MVVSEPQPGWRQQYLASFREMCELLHTSPLAATAATAPCVLGFSSPRTSRPATFTSNGTRGDPGGTATPASPSDRRRRCVARATHTCCGTENARRSRHLHRGVEAEIRHAQPSAFCREPVYRHRQVYAKGKSGRSQVT